MKKYSQLIVSFIFLVLMVLYINKGHIIQYRKNKELDKKTEEIYQYIYKNKKLKKFSLIQSSDKYKFKENQLSKYYQLVDKNLTIEGNDKTLFIKDNFIPFTINENIELVIKNLNIKLINTLDFINGRKGSSVKLLNCNITLENNSQLNINVDHLILENISVINKSLVNKNNLSLFTSSSKNIFIKNSKFIDEKNNLSFGLKFYKNNEIKINNSTIQTNLNPSLGSINLDKVNHFSLKDSIIKDKNFDNVLIIENNKQTKFKKETRGEVVDFKEGSIALGLFNVKNIDIKNNSFEVYNCCMIDENYNLLSEKDINQIKNENKIIQPE